MHAAQAGTDDRLAFTFTPDGPHGCSEFTISLAFVDGHVFVTERGRQFPLGIVPFLSLLHEPDLIVSILPSVLARPLRPLGLLHAFAENDLLLHCRMAGFGPIPGTELVASTLMYDLADEPCEPGAVLIVLETPPAHAQSYRGFALPEEQTGYTRARDLLAVAHVTPVDGCESHGRLDFTAVGKVRLPISRWLLPSPLIRWFLPFLFGLAFPYLCKLNATFEESALHARVLADSGGFYAALERRLPAMRRHAEQRRPRAVGVAAVCS